MKKRLLEKLRNFMLRNRRGGSSSLIKKMAEDADVWIVVPHAENKPEFGDKAVCLGELDKILEKDPKPVLLDNDTVMKLASYALSEIEDRETKIFHYDNFITSLKNKIQAWQDSEWKNTKI